jgi:chorismate mutase
MKTSIEQLIAALESIIANLKANAYPNEPAISTGVILRVLNLLGWDIYNPDFVWPEYGAGGRVDFALCFPEKKPAVFIEVKQPGKLIGADKQLFEYAFHEGVPFAVLCDGKTWGFYLPGVQGSYEERRVYKLDLLERTPKESAEKLIRYLEFERTKLGKAIADAKADHQDQNRRALSKQTIPKAWKELVEGEDPSIVEKIASEVEGKCGVRPVVDDVMEFLHGLGVPTLSPAPPPMPPPQPPPAIGRPHAPTPPVHGQTQRGYQLNDSFVACRSGVEVMIRIFETLAASDPTFPEKCHAHPANIGTVRTYVASSTAELYPGRPDLEEHSAEFTPGWFVATNLSNPLKAKVIRLAFNVAGLTENVNARFYL